MRLSGGDLIARTLREAGVDTLFTFCGGHISPILNGCVDAGIRTSSIISPGTEHTLQMKRALFDAR